MKERYHQTDSDDIFDEGENIDDYLRGQLGTDYSRIEVSLNEQGDYQTVAIVRDVNPKIY